MLSTCCCRFFFLAQGNFSLGFPFLFMKKFWDTYYLCVISPFLFLHDHFPLSSGFICHLSLHLGQVFKFAFHTDDFIFFVSILLFTVSYMEFSSDMLI